MINKFNLAIALAILSFASLGAQMIAYPAGCLPPEVDNLPVTHPKVYGEIQVDGLPAPVSDVVGVYNAAGELVGRGSTFSQSDGNGGTFTAVLIYLQTDPSGAPTCAFFTPGDEVTLVLENAPGLNLRATNSTFTGVPGALQGFLEGPDGVETEIDVFNFETRFLPVTFASLQASDLGGKTSIEWSTASESGNDYFVVEHGTTVGEFAEVGMVAGAGDSQELLSYDLVHDTPAAGVNYYRIKQVDFEGTFSYSGIVPVDVAGTPSEEISLFPNPASDYFNLNVGTDWNAEEVTVAVFNAEGRRVMEWAQSTAVTRQVFTNELPAGVYVVRVDGAQRTSTQRLVIE